jgi:hypothetical protein
MVSRHSASWKCPEFQAWIQPEFGVRIQILLDSIYTPNSGWIQAWNSGHFQLAEWRDGEKKKMQV